MEAPAVTSQASTTVYCLSVAKSVETTFTRTYSWSITKTVDVATWNLFDGQSVTSNYTVTVTKDMARTAPGR